MEKAQVFGVMRIFLPHLQYSVVSKDFRCVETHSSLSYWMESCPILMMAASFSRDAHKFLAISMRKLRKRDGYAQLFAGFGYGWRVSRPG
jgi:hypothetical protein